MHPVHISNFQDNYKKNPRSSKKIFGIYKSTTKCRFLHIEKAKFQKNYKFIILYYLEIKLND